MFFNKEKNYFDEYDLKIFKTKFRTHVFGMGGSSLSSKLLAQFLKPGSLDRELFIYDNPSPIKIKNNLLNLNINKKTINNNNPSAVHIFRFFNFLSGIIKLIYQSKIIRKLEINILLNN